jgi:terminal uridylyltransferase
MQIEHLDNIVAQVSPRVEMSEEEYEEKDAFRKHLEGILKQIIMVDYSRYIAAVSLVGFGSLSSGFAMPGSDMDLAMVADWKDFTTEEQKTEEQNIIVGSISRSLERAVLISKMGGRSLERTRVPILKICQYPTEALYTALVKERRKWEEAPGGEIPETGAQPNEAAAKKAMITSPVGNASTSATSTTQTESSTNGTNNTDNIGRRTRGAKTWARERKVGPLDFPKQGVGIQCDINFSNLVLLGIQNTHLLRCYSLTDHRVRPIVLLVKAWAKRRKINSAYSGTLSSYGWVLMVLHYLVNIAQPPVCPNLQLTGPHLKDPHQLANFYKASLISGHMVRFWRDEEDIKRAAKAGELSRNTQSVGALLVGFFQYYSSAPAYNTRGPRLLRFHWINEVLSLRTPGGILTKDEKDWRVAKTQTNATTDTKVTNRYLVCIEDPFELDHNVARTVIQKGNNTIREEFRRSGRILTAIGTAMQPEGGIFDEVIEDLAPHVRMGEVERVGILNIGQDPSAVDQEIGVTNVV